MMSTLCPVCGGSIRATARFCVCGHVVGAAVRPPGDGAPIQPERDATNGPNADAGMSTTVVPVMTGPHAVLQPSGGGRLRTSDKVALGALLALIASFVVVLVLRRNEDDKASPVTTAVTVIQASPQLSISATPAPGVTVPTTSLPPTPVASTEVVVVTVPPEPMPAEAPTLPPETVAEVVPATVLGDLGIAQPMSRPACDGQFVVMVGSMVDPVRYAEQTVEVLGAFPGSQYLRTDQTCPSLRASVNGVDPIYSVYFGPFPSSDSACNQRAALGGDAYVKVLDLVTPYTVIIDCNV